MKPIKLELVTKSKANNYSAFIIIAATCLIFISGCGNLPLEQRDAGSSIPWNQPEPWELEPSMGTPFTW